MAAPAEYRPFGETAPPLEYRPFAETDFILFTTRQGGLFRAIRATREEYDRAVETRELAIPGAFVGETERVQPAFIAFGTFDVNHDFILAAARA